MSEEKQDVKKEIEQAEVISFGKKDFNAYSRLMANIEKGFVKASDAYVMIAGSLWEIYHNEYYRIDDYKTIADFALEKYDFKKSTTHNYIKVMEKFGDIENGKAKGLKEQFQSFKCSQLINMLSFTPEQLEMVKPDWTVREIIDFGKKPLQIETNETDENSIDSNSQSTDCSEDIEEDEILTPPEIETGRLFLAECKSLSEIDSVKETLKSAYDSMARDRNFKNKNIRFVIELAFD